jgi:hypothetical protein
LTNAFSKKVENHAHAVALHMMFYNFDRVHGDAADYSSDGRWRDGSRPVIGLNCWAGKLC